MISSTTLYTIIIRHDLNGPCDKNIRLIQYLMRTSKPAGKKFNIYAKFSQIWPYSPREPHWATSNLHSCTCLLAKNPLGNLLLPFPMRDRLRHRQSTTSTSTSPSPLQATGFGSLSPRYSFAPPSTTLRGQKKRDWVALNAVLIPPLLTEATILDSETSAANLLKVFVKCITAKGSEEEDNKSEKEEEDCVTI